MGSECLKPICTEQSRNLNFTNEGGYDYRFRFLKNIMGLWMIQSIRREQQKTYSFAEICGMAEKCKMFPSRVDVNSPVFLAPESMTEAVRQSAARQDRPFLKVWESWLRSYMRAWQYVTENGGRNWKTYRKEI